jgi:AbrB family looped-hinge helix DNA binding protein
MKANSTILDIVTVNDKGQIVIPADARSISGISAGDKLLVMVHPSKDGLILMKPNSLEQYARNILSQVTNVKKDSDK